MKLVQSMSETVYSDVLNAKMPFDLSYLEDGIPRGRWGKEGGPGAGTHSRRAVKTEHHQCAARSDADDC